MSRVRTGVSRTYDERGVHVETPRSYYLLVNLGERVAEVHVRGRVPQDPKDLEALRELWRRAVAQAER